MMRRSLFALAGLAVCAHSHALIYGFAAPTIDPYQEVHDVVSPAYGSGSYTLDTDTWLITGSVTLTNLPFIDVTGARYLTMGHIHLGAPNVNGPVRFDILANTLPGTPLQVGNILIIGFSAVLPDPAGVETRQDVLDAMIAGNAYFNFHTTAYAAGEVRGQIHCMGVVPEPGTIAALSLGALALLRRRRAK